MKTNAGVWLYTVLAVFGSLLMDLQKLMNMPGVSKLSDIPQATIIGVIATALLAGIAIVKASITDSPANVKQANEIVSAVANLDKQSGFAHVRFLLLIAGLCAALLGACASLGPATTRQTLLAAYASAETAANTIEIAKRDGVIDAAKRDELLGSVKQARNLLNASGTLLANDPSPGSANDSEATANLRAAQNILLAIQAALPKEKTQ